MKIMKITATISVKQQLAATRNTWGINPVSRIKASKKVYNRQQNKAACYA